MTVTIFAKHEPYANGHLGLVADTMQHAGPPTIRCVRRSRDEYWALEGSHRLCAAHAAGLEPKLVLEPLDASDALAAFWERVETTLPRYDFAHAYVLDLSGA